MTKKTELYDDHVKLGAKIVDFEGWLMPMQYEGISKEHINVRTNAGIFDVSHMGTFEVSGKKAAEFLDYITPSRCVKLENMQAIYSFLLTEKAAFVDDIIVYKISDEKFYIVVNSANKKKDFEWIKSHIKDNIELADLSDHFTLIAIQGPKAESILRKITDTDITDIAPFHMRYINVKSIRNVLIARTGYTGEDGFEIFVTKENASQIWNMLIEAGTPEGLKPVGLGARDTLRLEMKYALYGHEIDDTTNPLEAGLRWVVKFKKSTDFIGKDALTKIKDAGITRKLIGFKMLDKAIPRHGYKIVLDGKEIGIVTSGTLSPSLQIPIGIGYVSKDFSETGSKFSIDIRGKERLAEVIETPFYRRPL